MYINFNKKVMENNKVEWISAKNESRPLEKHLHILDNVGIKRTGNFYKDDDLGVILLINKTELYNQFLVYEKDFNHYWYLSEINETRLSLPVEPLEACSGDVEQAATDYLAKVGNHERPDITKHDFIEGFNAAKEKYQYDYSKSCKCGESSIGQTWCCNLCGLPTSVHSNQSKSLNEAVELIKSALSIKDLWCNYSEKAEHEGENIAISNMAKSFEAFLSQFKQ